MTQKCVICIEPLMTFGEEDKIDVVCLPCGHIFHSSCIDQWLLTKLSCPKCRHKCTKCDIRKLFFDNHTISKDDPEIIQCLNNQIENLKFELNMAKKDSETKDALAKTELKKAKSIKLMVFNLEREVKKMESEKLSLIETNRLVLNEIQRLNEKTSQLDALRQELERYRSVDSILKGTPEEAGQILNDSDLNTDTLKELITTLKNSLVYYKKKCREKDNVIIKINNESLNQLSKINSLCSEVSTLERVLESYQTKVKELEFKNCNSPEQMKTQVGFGCGSSMIPMTNEQSLQSHLQQSNNVLELSRPRKMYRLSIPVYDIKGTVSDPSSSRLATNNSPTLKARLKVVTARRRK